MNSFCSYTSFESERRIRILARNLTLCGYFLGENWAQKEVRRTRAREIVVPENSSLGEEVRRRTSFKEHFKAGLIYN